MTQIVSLDNIADGFAAPAQDAQRTYRALLRAMSRPARPVVVDEHPGLDGVNAAAASVLLTLLDFDTTLYLGADQMSGPLAAWVRFHTNSQLTGEIAEADFALLNEAPDQAVFKAARQGDPKYPDRSATFIVQVPSLTGGERRVLEGPGIDGTETITVSGLGPEFWAAWQSNTRQFPLGVDLFLCAGSEIVGLPRTSRLAADA